MLREHHVKVCRLSSTVTLTLASLLMSLTLGARILCIFPDPSRSHAITYEPLTRALAARGHHVTVISTFPQTPSVANYTDIVLTDEHYGVERFFNNIYELRNMHPVRTVMVWWQQMNDICNYFLNNTQVQHLINSKDEHFDLIILEVVLHECFVGFAHRFQAPLVLMSSSRGTHWIWDLVGNSSPFAYIPSYIFAFSDRMTYFDRVANTMEAHWTHLGRRVLFTPRFDLLMRKYFNDLTMPYVTDIARNVSLLLIATHPSLDYPRPSVPALVSIGGIHIQPSKTLPNDLQQFLDDAVDGAVYFSLGSTLHSRFIPQSLRNTFVEGFSQLRMRILWSWDGEIIKDLPSNVRVGSWLPQADILAHPNVHVFLSQGGYVSMQESVYYSVPMVGIPIYGDQFWNLRLAQELGFGIRLDLNNVTTESLVWALNLANQNSYQEKAREASVKFRDNLQLPLEKAVYWTEYVIRHKGAPNLRVAALDMAWYQYFMLDAMVVAMAVPFSLIAAIFVLVKTIVMRSKIREKEKYIMLKML